MSAVSKRSRKPCSNAGGRRRASERRRIGERVASMARRGSRSSFRKWCRRTFRRSRSASIRSRRTGPSSSSTPRRAWAIGSRQVTSRRTGTSSVRRTSRFVERPMVARWVTTTLARSPASSSSSSVHNEGPVDVECAIARGELFLLQCRPVTTLGKDFPLEWRDPRDAELHWRRDDAHFSGPVPRLLGEYVTHCASLRSGAASRVLRCAGGRAHRGIQWAPVRAAQPRYPREELRRAHARFDRAGPRVRARPAAHLG